MIANDNVRKRSVEDLEALADIKRIVERMGAEMARSVVARSMIDEEVANDLKSAVQERVDRFVAILSADPRSNAHDLGVFREMLFDSVVRHGCEIPSMQIFEGGRA